MDSKILFMNLHQIIGTRPSSNVRPSDFSRELLVHVSRGAGDGRNISHVTIEFVGQVAKFYTCVMFDGSGDWGASIASFVMPRAPRLNAFQKSLGLLSVIDYLAATGEISPSLFDFYKERIESEYSAGAGTIGDSYAVLKNNSRTYVASRENGHKDVELDNFGGLIPLDVLKRIEVANRAAAARAAGHKAD